MSITKAQQTRLGAFMIVTVILLCIFIAIPVGFKLANRTKAYYSYFEGESLSGLDEGANVKFHGVLIGKVGKISYDLNDLTRVKVEFAIKADFPMKEDMYAQTGMMGITGLKYMEILGGTNESKQLKEHSEIPAKQSFIASITGKSEVIIAKIELLLNHLNAITHPDSLKSIKKILSNVEGITGTTDKFMDDITPDVKQITASVKSTLKKVDMISSDIRTVTGGISDSLDLGQLTQIIPMIDSSVQSMKSLTENLDMTIKQSREDFAVGLENLREALENANELTKVLLENPSLIIRSETQKERRIQ